MRTLPKFALTLSFVLVSAGWAQAIDIQEIETDRGITAWLVEDDALPVVSVSFAFTGGASQDPEGKAGVANLVSGTLDEGAGAMDSKAFQSALSDLSIELSYDTGRDNFTGTLRTLTENLETAATLTRRSLMWPRFDDEPVERIRAQIVANIRRDARDPNSIAGSRLMELAFADHVYARPVDGTVESVAAITVEDLRTFHRNVIARDNLTVAVVGDITAEELPALLDRMFGGLPQSPDLVSVDETVPVSGARDDVPLALPQANIRLIAPGIKRDDPEFIDAYVAAYILGGGGFGSRLFNEIREERGLAYSVGLGLGAFDHAGLVSAGTSTRADQADEVVDLLVDEIRRYAEEGPSEDELRDAKDYLIGSYPLRFTTSRRIANQLLYIQLDNLGIDYVDIRNDLIEELEREDVHAAARRLFSDGEFTIVTVGAEGS